MQRRANLIEILGLLISLAGLALSLDNNKQDSVTPYPSQSNSYEHRNSGGYDAYPASPWHRYDEYYEPEWCDPYSYYCE